MKIFKLLFNLFFILVFSSLYGQSNEIYSVNFKFHHSRRIPDAEVSVDIERYGDSIYVSVKSIPRAKAAAEWDKTILNDSFMLPFNEYEAVVAAVKKINCADIADGLDFVGKDGSTCEIEFAGITSSIRYKVWAPTCATESRHLQAFLDACKLILVTAKLDPEKIL